MGREIRNVIPNYKHPKDENGNYIPKMGVTGPKNKRKWIQVYETVSEGTPVTPPFETEDELIAYLVEKGDFWRQKEGSGGYDTEACKRFIKIRHAPSLVVCGGKFYQGINSLLV